MIDFNELDARVAALPRPAALVHCAGSAVRVAPLARRLGEPVTIELVEEGIQLLRATPGEAAAGAVAALLGRVEEIPEYGAEEGDSPQLHVLHAVEVLAGALRIARGDPPAEVVSMVDGAALQVCQTADWAADQRTRGLLGRKGKLLVPLTDGEIAAQQETLALLTASTPLAEAAERVFAVSYERAAALEAVVPTFAAKFGLVDHGR